MIAIITVPPRPYLEKKIMSQEKQLPFLTKSLPRKKTETLGLITNPTDGKRNLYSMLNSRWQAEIDKLDPAILTWPETKLEKHAEPCETFHALRINFWAEYYRAMDTGANSMELKNVLRGAASHHYFYAKLFNDSPYLLAWMLSPPRSLAIQQEELLTQVYKKMRAFIIEGDIYDEKTVTKTCRVTKQKEVHVERKLNTRALDSLRKIAQVLNDRVQGTTIQKHAILTQSNTPNTPLLTPKSEEPSREELEAEMAAIDAEVIGDEEE